MRLIVLTVLLFSACFNGFGQIIMSSESIDPDSPKLKVTGSAVLYQKPEIMHIDVIVEVTDLDHQNCFAKLNDMQLKFKNRLVESGIEEEMIISDSKNVEENIEWVDGKDVNKGYLGYVFVKVKMKNTPENLNTIVDITNEDCFNFECYIDFSMSPEQKTRVNKRLTKLGFDIVAKKKKEKSSEFDFKKVVKSKYGFVNYDIIEEDEIYNKNKRLTIKPKRVKCSSTVSVVWEVVSK